MPKKKETSGLLSLLYQLFKRTRKPMTDLELLDFHRDRFTSEHKSKKEYVMLPRFMTIDEVQFVLHNGYEQGFVIITGKGTHKQKCRLSAKAINLLEKQFSLEGKELSAKHDDLMELMKTHLHRKVFEPIQIP